MGQRSELTDFYIRDNKGRQQVYLCVSRPHADTDCFFNGPLVTHPGYLTDVK